MMLPLFILLLCMAIVSWRSVVGGAAIVLLLLPTYLLRMSLAGISTNVLEVLICVLVLVWGVRRITGFNRSSLARLPWRWTILFLLLTATVSVFVSPEKVDALGFLKSYFVIPVLFFLLLWESVHTERDTMMLLGAIGLSSAALSLVAVFQYVHLLPSLEPWISEVPQRVTSVFEYPNALGLFLSPVVALFAAFVLLPTAFPHRVGWFRVLSFAVVLLGIAGILAALSRGAVLGVGAALVFLGAVSPYRRWVFTTLLLAAALLVVVPGTRSMLVGVIRGTDVSTDVRTVLWQGTARLLADRPIVGAGLGGFPTLYNEYRLTKHTELPLYPHNIILNTWVELGLAGLLLFCWLVLDAFLRSVRLLRNALPPFNRTILYAVCAALIAVFLHGFVDVPYFKNDLAVQFWFLLALIPLAGRIRAAGQNR